MPWQPLRRTVSLERALVCVLAPAVLAGCGVQRYQPAPLDPARTASAIEARSAEEAGLRDYMALQGQPAPAWPLARWGLPELTLAAFYFQPELARARAEAKVARAEVAAATQPPPFGVTPLVAHHSRVREDETGPWSLGLALEVPVIPQSRRDALRERYGALADAAALKVDDAAWQVRSRVRASALALHASRTRLALIEEEVRGRRELSDLLERRVKAGLASSVALNAVLLRQAELEGEQQSAAVAAERSLADLAQAIGLPVSRVREFPFDLSVFDAAPPAPGEAEAQRAALLNRIDVRTKLLEYAAADAAVKFEIARQYPALTLKPGYLWDQGDNVWAIAAAILVPAAGNGPAIRAAEAQRELAAEEFKRLQSRVIGDADAARARYLSAVAGAARATAILDLGAERSARTQAQFDAGYADRVDLVGVRLEQLATRRNALALRVEAQQALGALEEALQVPLAGAPLPRVLSAANDIDRSPRDADPR